VVPEPEIKSEEGTDAAKGDAGVDENRKVEEGGEGEDGKVFDGGDTFNVEAAQSP